jgi:predicted nucleic acid-binding protein
MATLIDTSLWIDFTRARSPQSLKRFIASHILAPDVALAEPVTFEILRYATDTEAAQLHQQFRHLPLLPTPTDLWPRAAKLGQRCRKDGIHAGAIDLLISTVAAHHGAQILTFDADFQAIADIGGLRVRVLKRPNP